MIRIQAVSLLLRIGLAFSFIYAAVAAAFSPDDWIGYFPSFLIEHMSHSFLLNTWGLFEIVIGVWLISGKRVFIPSILAFLSLLGLLVFNIAGINVLFRDITIALMALALAVLHFPRNHGPRYSA